ncbi:uncharacterized protein LOC101454538, partial [Ceratitis capitata]|uniref:uncharacterized protein LOC101454538 n=1 Tax=Ceratitis capitata TaxID=7213 RepID=UPI000A11AD0A
MSNNGGNITTLLHLILQVTTVHQKYLQTLTDIVHAASQDRSINTLIYTTYEHHDVPAPLHSLQSEHILTALAKRLPTQPLIHFDHTPPVEELAQRFNKDILTIAKLNQQAELDERLLKTLWQRLLRNTQTRLILLFDDLASEMYVANLMKICVKHRAFHVIALQPRMTVTAGNYWCLRIFPKEETFKCRFATDHSNIFPKPLANMHGHPIRLLQFSWYPQIYYYTPKVGGPAQLSGFVGRGLAEYARYYNATIAPTRSYQNSVIKRSDSVQLLDNDTIDLTSSTPFYTQFLDAGLPVIYYYSELVLMVPMEQPLPKATFYYNIVQETVAVLFCLTSILYTIVWQLVFRWEHKRQLTITADIMNFSIFIGLLGLPFDGAKCKTFIQKIMLFTISIAGVIIGTAYGAYLGSFIVDAPIASPVQTIDDLLERGIKVAGSMKYLIWISNTKRYRKYANNFTIFENYSAYHLKRDELDTRYAFLVTDMWPLYEEQQKYFTRPLFRLSNICLGARYPMVLALQRNSIHREAMHKHVLYLSEAGLIDYWQRHIFVEFLDMGWLVLEDRNKREPIEPMRLEDLRLVLMEMFGLLILCVICFIFE